MFVSFTTTCNIATRIILGFAKIIIAMGNHALTPKLTFYIFPLFLLIRSPSHQNSEIIITQNAQKTQNVA